MSCSLGLIFLPCSRSGKGLTAKALDPDGRKLQLMAGHGSRFPDVVGGGHYYVRVEGCNSCCEVMKVVGKDADVLIVERDYGTQCNCIHSNSSVQYSLDNAFAYQDLAAYIPIKVTDPLSWNCETNTLSIDCSKLFDGSCGDCGCDCENGTPDNEVTGSGANLRGGKGDKGDPGVGISNITITAAGFMTVTLDNGKVIQAGKVPQAKGVPGDKGDKGDKGDQGDKGDPGKSIAGVRVDNYEMIVTMEDGTETNVGNIRGAKGDKGDPGAKGDKGDKGDLPYVQYIQVGNKARIFGPANTNITIGYMTTDDAAANKAYSASSNARTNGNGSATIPALPAGMFLEFYADGKLVGIGSS